MRKIAIDPGFGGFKIAEVRDNTLLTQSLPAVVGTGSTDIGYLGIGLGRQNKNKPHRVSFDTIDYLVGQNVHRYAQPIERLDFQRLAEGPELRALLYTALWKMVGIGTHTAALMVGLPVEIVQDRKATQETLRTLRSWLIDTHHFQVDGQPVTLTIGQVKGMAQPVGSYFAWGANLAGAWQQKESLKLDIGDYGTLVRPTRYSSPFNPSTRPAWRSPGYANIVKTYGSQTRTAGIPVTEGYGGLKAVPEKAVDTSAFVGDLFGNRTPSKKSAKITATSNYEQLTREVGKVLAPPTISVSGKGERPLRVEALDQFADGRILAEAYYGEADGSWTPITDEKSQAKIATFITDKFKKLSAIAD